MKTPNNEVYVEFTAARDRFCLLHDFGANEAVKRDVWQV